MITHGAQIFSVNVTPPFADEHPDMTPPKGVHSANDISQTKKKHFVDAETLHSNCLGHRSVSLMSSNSSSIFFAESLIFSW
jgi:hypothetical protein